MRNKTRTIIIVILSAVSLLLLVISCMLTARLRSMHDIVRNELLATVGEIAVQSDSVMRNCDGEIDSLERGQETLWYRTDRLWLELMDCYHQVNSINHAPGLHSEQDAVAFSRFNQLSVMLQGCRDLWNRFDRLNPEAQSCFVLFYRKLIHEVQCVFETTTQYDEHLKGALSQVERQLSTLLDVCEESGFYHSYLKEINIL